MNSTESLGFELSVPKTKREPWLKKKKSCFPDSNPRDSSRKENKLHLLPLCHRVLIENIFNNQNQKVKTWICYFQIFSHFKKYFQKIFSKIGQQTYFHFCFPFFVKMTIGNDKPNTPVASEKKSVFSFFDQM